MTVTEKANYSWTAWSYAVEKGYVYSAIERHVGRECFNLLAGGLAGVVAAVGGVMVCSAAGGVIGGALGGYFSAGNPAAAYASAQLGATIGRTIAETALVVLGVASIGIYMLDHMWEIGSLAIAAYDLATNQMPYLGGPAYDYMLDLAARWFAEAVGLFCGFLVFAIACLVLARMAKAPKGQTAAQSVMDLFNSKLNDLCNGLVKWVVPRAQELRYKMQPAGKIKFSVINGGIAPEQMSILTRTLQFTRQMMPRLIDAGTRVVKLMSLEQLNKLLTSLGFKLTGYNEWGPAGGRQLFYERGNICVRIKSMGDAGGPRAGKPHLSVGVNDGLGTAWTNDMAKVTPDGRLTFKVDMPAKSFKPTENISNPGTPTPQRYVGIQGGKQTGDPMALQDAWASNCHFNFDGKFSWKGLDTLLQGVPKVR